MGAVDVNVDIRTPSWMDVTTLRVYENGTVTSMHRPTLYWCRSNPKMMVCPRRRRQRRDVTRLPRTQTRQPRFLRIDADGDGWQPPLPLLNAVELGFTATRATAFVHSHRTEADFRGSSASSATSYAPESCPCRHRPRNNLIYCLFDGHQRFHLPNIRTHQQSRRHRCGQNTATQIQLHHHHRTRCGPHNHRSAPTKRYQTLNHAFGSSSHLKKAAHEREIATTVKKTP